MRPSNKYIYIQFYIVSEGGTAKECSKIVLKIAHSLRALYGCRNQYAFGMDIMNKSTTTDISEGKQ